MITQQVTPQPFNKEEFLNKFNTFQSFTVSSKKQTPELGKAEAVHSFLAYIYHTLELENTPRLEVDEEKPDITLYNDRVMLDYLSNMISLYCYIIDKKEINISKVLLTDLDDVLKSNMLNCFQLMSGGVNKFMSGSSMRILLLNVINFVFTAFVTRTNNIGIMNDYLNIV